MKQLTPLIAIALLGCTPQDAALDGTALDIAPPPLVLEATDAIMNGQLELRITGGLANEEIHLLRSLQGIGQGPCPSLFGGLCIGIRGPSIHDRTDTNGSGAKTETYNVPSFPGLAGSEVCWQAGAARGPQSELSNVVCSILDYDTDGDGVVDSIDPCPQGDDRYDADGDGIADACDNPQDRFEVFTAVDIPPSNWETGSFQSRDFTRYIPNNPEGVIWFFHGTGGTHELAQTPEGVVLLEEFISRGFGFVAINSQDRSGGAQWDDDTGPNNNDDWQRLDDWRDNMVNAGMFNNNTPMYTLGFSNGGTMASYVGHAGPANGWPISAIAYHASSGRSGFYGQAADHPSIFIAGVNDTAVTPADVELRYDQHIAAGYDGEYYLTPEQPIAPTRFVRAEFVNDTETLEYWSAGYDNGFINGQGAWIWPGDLEDGFDDFVALPEVGDDSGMRGVLRACLAVHRINSWFAEDEADYFFANR